MDAKEMAQQILDVIDQFTNLDDLQGDARNEVIEYLAYKLRQFKEA